MNEMMWYLCIDVFPSNMGDSDLSIESKALKQWAAGNSSWEQTGVHIHSIGGSSPFGIWVGADLCGAEEIYFGMTLSW